MKTFFMRVSCTTATSKIIHPQTKSGVQAGAHPTPHNHLQTGGVPGSCTLKPVSDFLCEQWVIISHEPPGLFSFTICH